MADLVLLEAHGQRLLVDTGDVESSDASTRRGEDGLETITVTHLLKPGARGRWVEA